MPPLLHGSGLNRGRVQAVAVTCRNRIGRRLGMQRAEDLQEEFKLSKLFFKSNEARAGIVDVQVAHDTRSRHFVLERRVT